MEKSQKRSKKQKIVKKPVIRMLGPADPSLGDEPKVLARFTLCPEIQKDVEHVGKGYEKL
jgi:DnaJ family protein C protein 2